jgi:hypothetical protein
MVNVVEMTLRQIPKIATRTTSWAAFTCMTVLFAGGCRGAAVTSEPNTAVQAAAPLARSDYIPAQTVLNAQLGQTLSTESSQPGDRFTATVRDNLMAADGSVVVPTGSVVTGVVREVQTSGHVGEQAAIRLEFQTIAIHGRAHPLAADVVETHVETSRGGGAIARGAGGGALAGGVLGAILGGGSGALKGGLIGAAGGTLIGLGTGDVEAKLPAGTGMTLRTTQPIQLH